MFHKRVRTVTRLDADQSYGTHDRETPCLVHVNISVYVSTYNYYEDLYSPLKWQHKLQKKPQTLFELTPRYTKNLRYILPGHIQEQPNSKTITMLHNSYIN